MSNTQIDELVKRLRLWTPSICREAADALESQAAREKELEQDNSAYKKLIEENPNSAWAIIASLKTQLAGLRRAARLLEKAGGALPEKNTNKIIVDKDAYDALMSTLRNTETKEWLK